MFVPTGAIMNQSEILEKIKNLKPGEFLDLHGANLLGANLSGADLSRTYLHEANLSWADLSGANLLGANLSYATLSYADLSRADLFGADLSRADLSRADLFGADLSWADLSRADLSGANLLGAYLHEANLSWADLSGANLSNIKFISAIGNREEIKSAQFDTYDVVWTADTLAIGCQQHPITKWKKADPRWIAAMADDATEWWAKHGEFVLNMIEHSPATGKIIAD